MLLVALHEPTASAVNSSINLPKHSLELGEAVNPGLQIHL